MVRSDARRNQEASGPRPADGSIRKFVPQK
jgi:hypothetical protein